MLCFLNLIENTNNIFSKFIPFLLFKEKLLQRKAGPLGLPEPTGLSFWNHAEASWLEDSYSVCQSSIDSQTGGCSARLPEIAVGFAKVLPEGAPGQSQEGRGRLGKGQGITSQFRA